MSGDSIAELTAYAAAEAWAEVEDPDTRRGIAMVLGKVLSPDNDSEFQVWLAGLVLAGIEAEEAWK